MNPMQLTQVRGGGLATRWLREYQKRRGRKWARI